MGPPAHCFELRRTSGCGAADSMKLKGSGVVALALAGFALAAVSWWRLSQILYGQGDLRPYLLLDTLPLALIPLWQAIYSAPRGDRIWFGSALGIYALGKCA